MPAFLFSDIESSTSMWEQHPEAMAAAMRRHDAILYQTIEESGGRVVEHTGDGVYAVFEDANPLPAALQIQRHLAQEKWGELGEVRVRIGIHAAPENREGLDFFRDGKAYRGLAVNETARVTSIGWGGQILLTPDALQKFTVPSGATLHDLGSHMLKSLTQPRQIYLLTHPDLPVQEFPPLRSLSVRPNNLPPQNTSFVGREKELRGILHTLKQDSTRLLTLAGPGGVGKTRLAIQAAAEAIEFFPDGVFFAPLASVNTLDAVVPTIARAVDFSFYSGSNQKLQLLNYLREKELLLVVDNLEHLLESTQVLNEILEAAPRVKVMVTCREWLNASGEQRYQLLGMDVPRQQQEYALPELVSYSAVQLFLQVARRTQPDFTLTHDNYQAVVKICRLVAGMPLGIELAAAWISAFSCEEIAEQIELNLGFLATNRPEVPDRHRSLFAVCDYFWSHLAPAEQNILCRLSLFHGGFSAEAAWEVAGASYFFLSALLDRAFLQRTALAEHTSGKARYEMHEVLRQFADEKMAQRPQQRKHTRTKHAAYYAGFLEERIAHLKSEQQETVLANIHREIDNVRAAWKWAVANRQAEVVSRALDCLYLVYGFLAWYKEGEEVFGEAVWAFETEAVDAHELLVARLRTRQAYFLQRTSNVEEARQMLLENLEVFERHHCHKEKAGCLHGLGTASRIIGHLEDAEAAFQESARLYREQGRQWELGLALQHLSDTNYRMGRVEEARELMWDSYVIRQKLNEPRSLATTLVGLGIYLNAVGEPQAARVLLQGGLSKHRSIPNNDWNIATSTMNLGVLDMEAGRYEEARRYFQRSLSLFRDLGDPWTIAAALANLGQLALFEEQWPEAREYLREALQVALDGHVTQIALDVLVGIAQLIAASGNANFALNLLAYVLDHPQTDRAETAVQAERVRARLQKAQPRSNQTPASEIDGASIESVVVQTLALLDG
jgi:predicted ATPase/class 3 adenylate cyclase